MSLNLTRQQRKLCLVAFIVITILFQGGSSQNSYPTIVSGAASFVSIVPTVPKQFNIGYLDSFQIGSIVQCVHTISGLEFQTVSMVNTPLFNFNTSITVCTNYMITMRSLVSDNYIKSIKSYYLVISNQNSMTWVLALIIPIIDGETSGPIRNPTPLPNSSSQHQFSYYYSLGGFFMPPGQTNIVEYPCLQSLQIGTNGFMSFNLDTNYHTDITTLVTTISVQSPTYILSIGVTVIIFNLIQRVDVYNSYFTYCGFQSYESTRFSSAFVNFNANVTHYDENYFFPFVGLSQINLNFSNISKTYNGSTLKNFWLQYSNPTWLKFKTDFMQDHAAFDGANARFWYLVITKYRNATSANNVTNVSDSTEGISNLIIIIVVSIISISFVLVMAVVVYKNCHIQKRLIRKSFHLQSCQNIRFQA